MICALNVLLYCSDNSLLQNNELAMEFSFGNIVLRKQNFNVMFGESYLKSLSHKKEKKKCNR